MTHSYSRGRLFLACVMCLLLPLVLVVPANAAGHERPVVLTVTPVSPTETVVPPTETAVPAATPVPSPTPLPKTYVEAGNALTVTISRLIDEQFPDVSAYLTVLGPNGIPLAGLESGGIKVAEDGSPIEEFDLNLVQHAGTPLTLAIAIDRSNSMWLQDENGLTALQNTLDAVGTLLQKLGPNDTVGIYTFSSEVEMLQDFTIDKELAERTLAGLEPEGATVLWDAVREAMTGLRGAREGRKAILVVTDGKEGEGDTVQSSVSLDDLISELAEADIPVFPVGFGDVDATALGRLAEESGGQLYIAEETETLSDEFDEILQLLQLQYALHFRSNLSADGGEHLLTITVIYLGAEVAAESTFTALLSECQITLPGVQDGQLVRGMLTLEPALVCRSEPSAVTLLLDGELLATLEEPPFNIEWDSTETTLGAHNLTLSVIDANGNTGELQFEVEVIPDELTMVLHAYQQGELLDYEEGKPVTGIIIIEPTFIGPAEIKRVDYSTRDGLPHMHNEKEGTPLYTSRETPFEFEWDTSRFSAGLYTLEVVAEDEEGNTASAHLGVEIVPAITLEILAPKENTQLSGEIKLQAQAQALAGIQTLEFLVDDTLIVTITQEPFEHTWDTSTVAPGEHTLTIRAIDSKNEVLEISVPVVVEVGANLGFLVVLVVAGASVAIVFTAAVASRRRNKQRSSGAGIAQH